MHVHGQRLGAGGMRSSCIVPWGSNCTGGHAIYHSPRRCAANSDSRSVALAYRNCSISPQNMGQTKYSGQTGARTTPSGQWQCHLNLLPNRHTSWFTSTAHESRITIIDYGHLIHCIIVQAVLLDDVVKQGIYIHICSLHNTLSWLNNAHCSSYMHSQIKPTHAHIGIPICAPHMYIWDRFSVAGFEGSHHIPRVRAQVGVQI